MRFLISILLLGTSSTLLIPTTRADDSTAKDKAPLFCEQGKQLISDDFASGTLDPKWHIAKGKWEIKDGAVRGDELPADMHNAVLMREQAVHNLVAEFSFRFDGGSAFAFSLNNKAGHVCRAKISPASLEVAKDSPGKNSPDKGAVLDSQKLDLKAGEWHTAIVEIGGKTIVASIDGKVVAFGSHDGIDVGKTSIRFPVTGAGVSIKALRIYDAKLPADPAAALKKLEALHAKTASAASR